MAHNVIENLQKLNSKERFWLIGHALGNDGFHVSAPFRSELATALGNKTTVPENAFVAMDYHLDWLFASLQMAFHLEASKVYPPAPEITGNQEDADLLIAFESSDGVCHIVIIEAKGVSGFTNDQLLSKAKRLRVIFEDGRFPGVQPHFILVSPPRWRLQQINTTEWPTWMRNGASFYWMELPIPRGLQKVTRSDATGKANQKGPNWTVEARHY